MGDLVDVVVQFDVVVVNDIIAGPLTSVFFSFDEVVVVKSCQELCRVCLTC